MRLFGGLFTRLLTQALLAVTLTGAALAIGIEFAWRKHGMMLNGAARAYLQTQYLGVGAIMLGLFLVLLLGAIWIARRWARPQFALYQAMRSVAQGDYDIEFPETGPAETRSTMRNLGRIARTFDRIETARRTWLVAISEELRSPIQVLQTHLQGLHDQEGVIERQSIADIAEEVRRLAELAEDLHAVALADLGRLPVQFESVDPRALIHNAVWANQARAEKQKVHLETGKLPESASNVKWDGERIEQLFTALIENSLRYTPAGGRIQLSLDNQRNAWRLIVDDTAPGVDVNLAQRLFEPFYRASNVPGETATSSSLGLATAQTIVEAHHGRIEAGRSPIGGLRVVVILPGAPPTA